MAQRRPDRELIPAVQKLRIQYAKRGRMRFTSHRDFQRALERALRRAEVPMAYSAGFSPHPKISYANAAPTGAASEAEYVEIGVVVACDPEALARELDAALPPGLDVVTVVEAHAPDLMNRLEASQWLIDLPGTRRDEVAAAWQAVLDRDEVQVERMTKSGPRRFDVRSAIIGGTAEAPAETPQVEVTLRHQVPLVRPDDLLLAMRVTSDFRPVDPPVLRRVCQGPLRADGTIGDPLEVDRHVLQ